MSGNCHPAIAPPTATFCRNSPIARIAAGASLGYQLASVIAGGPAPLIAAWLFGRTHSVYSIAFYILACSLLSLVATAMMKDFTGKDIEGEYE